MATAQINFFSDVLGVSTALRAILPQLSLTKSLADCSVLYLLHGWSDDETTWTRRTALERYCERRPLVVLMPRGGLSYYQDMVAGQAFWQHISMELPEMCRCWLGISPPRERCFVAGLSMGGYGALRLALSFPERFKAAAAFSAVTDLDYAISRKRAESKKSRALIDAIWGNAKSAPQEADVFFLAQQCLQKKMILPAVYQSCGTEDFLYQDNIKFREHMKNLVWPEHVYRDFPGGHTWDIWDKEIEFALDWFYSLR